MLALSPSPTNNAGIATDTVEDRGDIMAKGRKIQILGCHSCLPSIQRATENSYASYRFSKQ
jgi:hypothetical protein